MIEQANPTNSPEAVLDSLQEKLGLRFEQPELLREALTHASYVNERPCELVVDNQRLEFLGDAVLGLLIADELYRRYPLAREGQLTAMRAAIVRTESLARISRQVDLSAHLFLGRGEEASGGRYRPATLCAALEAVIGAVFLDQGLERTRAFVRELFREAFAALEPQVTRDAKSLLQELIQADLHHTPVYRTISESGPDHAKEFIVEARVGDQVLGCGRGRSKQAAEQAAARAALRAYSSPDSTTQAPIAQDTPS